MYTYLGPLLEVAGIAPYAAGSALNSSQAGEITCSKVFLSKRQHHENVTDLWRSQLTSNL
jgi:hypothetical protein